ncbi:hypothetical protein [Nocardia grenadensis]|uniref:hypothetical protein n=1 Tax=Nocardia grenadensis TaxID=931537 RepID=UPI003D8EDD13
MRVPVRFRRRARRTLAVQDTARSGARLDAYLRPGAGDPHRALAGDQRRYDPARDEEARFRVETLRAAFDALIPIRETTPVRWLPETGTA